MPRHTLALVLAGGHGTRLGALSSRGAKPALPFAGSLRVIDFALANCLNSGIPRVAVLTQYKAQRLIRHLMRGAVELGSWRGMAVEVVPAQQQMGESWYRGTADAVFQNLELIEESGARQVLVLAGDHVYKMDYARMLDEHRRRRAEATVACLEVPCEEASAFGVMSVDDRGRVTAFAEKPGCPDPVPGRPTHALASMGIYVFDVALLGAVLREDAADARSLHDFGYSLLPALLARRRVFAHRFDDSCVRAAGREAYWRDIGTLDAYWRANMDQTLPHPPLDLADPDWPVVGAPVSLPAARFVGAAGSVGVVDSLVAGGCVVEARVMSRSVLSPQVRVGRGSELQDCVLLPGAVVGRDVVLRRCIVDEGCVLPDGFDVGIDPEADRRRFHVTEAGVALVTPAMLGGGPGACP